MRRGSHEEVISPFNHGPIRNLFEFCGWNCFKAYRGKKIDWRTVYDLDSIEGITAL